MEATELRIGDLVSVNGEPMKIAETDLTYFTAWKKDGTFCNKIGYETAEPIALTKEILEKNGWKENDEIWTTPYPFGQIAVEFFKWDTEKVAMVSVVSCSMSSDTNTLRQTRYVHQLQHLLWALGIEKEIQL